MKMLRFEILRANSNAAIECGHVVPIMNRFQSVSFSNALWDF